MSIEYKDDWLEIRNIVVLNPKLEDSILHVRPYFEKAQHKAFVTSGLRTPYSQLWSAIVPYAKQKGLDTSIQIFQTGLENHWDVNTKVISSDEIKKTFQLEKIYWWQPAWSKLLNLKVIVNPPIRAVCLEDSIKANGENRKGKYINASTHSSGDAYDVGGGTDGTPQNEFDILTMAKADPLTKIKSILLEGENNAVHVIVV